MNYKKTRVPFLKNKEIKKQADTFRKKLWNNSIPIDIERIIDTKLEINIIPIPELKKQCDVDALITSNWKSMYVDRNQFLDDHHERHRLRFSFAHEIGHFVLHKKLYPTFNIESIQDSKKFIQEIPQKQYNYLEAQANKFANYLLIPRRKLLSLKKKLLKKIPSQNIDKKTLNSYLAVPLSENFKVSEQAAEIALGEINSNK